MITIIVPEFLLWIVAAWMAIHTFGILVTLYYTLKIAKLRKKAVELKRTEVLDGCAKTSR